MSSRVEEQIYMVVMSNIGEKIGDGAVAEVYVRDGRAIKLYKRHISKQEAFYEAFISTAVETTGLSVPKIFGVLQIDNSWALEMELLDGCVLSKLIEQQPSDIDKYLDIMVYVQIEIHRILNLPPLLSQRQKIERRIKNASVLSINQREELISELLKMPDKKCLCHGDYHFNNLLISNGKVFIIDWVDAAIGDPAADVCRTYMLFKIYAAGIADAYIERYSYKSGIPISAIKAWLPFITAARLAENKSNETEQLLNLMNK